MFLPLSRSTLKCTTRNMKTIHYPENQRGHANHGWLDAHHTFSFASWYNPERTNFGVLRVLNDDRVAPGMGFGQHPHDNMEIITIPLSGAIRHKDTMGNQAIVQAGEIQVMSAGTGIQHSETNPNDDQDLTLFQIWLFPDKRNHTPRYDQRKLNEEAMHNQFAQILSPNEEDDNVWIHQNAWFNMGKFTEDKTVEYTLNDPANGLFVMQVEGSSTVAGTVLNRRDGIGIVEAEKVSFDVKKDATLLLMEVPLSLNY